MQSCCFRYSFWKQKDKHVETVWKYCLELHPCINSAEITIITNQDKGQKNAISEYLRLVGNFHCSYHRRQNIIKMCRGGGGKIPNSALWMYNKLLHCRSVALIEHNKREHFKAMKSKDIQYLNSLTNELYAMGNNIYICIIVHPQE